MNATFLLTRHTTVETYLYSGQFERREVLFDPDTAEVTNLKRVALLGFDLSPLRGCRIIRGRLSVKMLTPDYPLEVAVTSVAEDWDPQFATNYRRTENQAWAGDLWLTDVIMGNGGSVYGRVSTSYQPETAILSFDVPVAVLLRMAAGVSFGLGLIDCKSRSYAPLDAENLWCGADVHKRIGASASCGFIPSLEVEFESTLETVSHQRPAAPFGLSATATADPYRLGKTSVTLNWNMPPQPEAPLLFYRLRVSENGGEFQPVGAAQIPMLRSGDASGTTTLHRLRPEAEYRFELAVSNGVVESEPASATVRTPVARSAVPAEVFPPLFPMEEGWLEGAGFAVGVASEMEKFDPVTGVAYFGTAPLRRVAASLVAPGERIGFHLVVENRTQGPAEFSVGVVAADSNAEDVARAVTLRRDWYLRVRDRWYPEVIVPLGADNSFAIPAADNPIPDQRFQQIFVDVRVPETARPGTVRFSVEIARQGQPALAVPFVFEVAEVQRAEANFNVELNGYVAIARCAGLEAGDSDAERVETEYYRLAHAHGMECNILPYFHTGIVQEGFAPVIEMRDGVPTVTDWGPWDRHFDRYLSGAYTMETDGRAIPLTHIYLPFHENWPMPIAQYYTVTPKHTVDDYPENINEHKLLAHSLDEDFKPGYREGIKAILKEFIRHMDEKGYGNVEFQYFFNNKHFYKQKGFVDRSSDRKSLEFWLVGPTCGNDGLGTSWWLLDEPNFMDDWDALHYYASILREAQKETGSGRNFRFRADISCYNHLFDSLDGLLDLGVCTSLFYDPREPYMRERQALLHEDHWMYGSWNGISEDNLSTALWFLDAYLRGAGGIIPWYNYALDANYEQPDTCAALYPGKRFGSEAPFPSLRLKAGRKAVEIIRCLETFRQRFGYSGPQLRSYVVGLFRSMGLELEGTTLRTSEVDAGTVQYRTAADARVLEVLKENLLRTLTARSSGR